MGDDFDRSAAAQLARTAEDRLWDANLAFDPDWTPDSQIAVLPSTARPKEGHSCAS
jgi:hypothetical protein